MSPTLLFFTLLASAAAADLGEELAALRKTLAAADADARLRTICRRAEDLAACEAWGLSAAEEVKKESLPVAAGLLTTLRDLRHHALGAESENPAILVGLGGVTYLQVDLPGAESLFTKALAILKSTEPDSVAVAEALTDLATIYDDKSEWNKAIATNQEALRIRRKVLVPNSLPIAVSLNNLGEVYDSAGDYTKAEQMYKEALAVAEIADPKGATLGGILNDLAELYHTRAKYAEAEPIYMRSLAIFEAIDPDNTDTAIALDNLAGLYSNRGEYARAEPLRARALKIRVAALGLENPTTAVSIFNTGTLYYHWGQYVKAEEYYRQSLAIREKVTGPDSPDVAGSLDALAQTIMMEGRYAAAEPLFDRALAIRKAKLGAHNDTASTMDNLAVLYYSQGDYAKAEPLYLSALAIHEKTLPAGHPDTLSDMGNLALLYRSEGAFAKAEILDQKVLELRVIALGPLHHVTGVAATSLADVYRDEKRYAEAAPLYERALRIFETALPALHPDIAVALNNLGAVYALEGDFARAEPLHRRALEIQAKALAPDHPERAITLTDIAKIQYARKDFWGAAQSYASALEILNKAVGPDHPDTLALEMDYARDLWRLGRKSEACGQLLAANRAVTEFWARTLIAVEEPRRRSLVAKFEELFPLTMTLAAEWYREDPAGASKLAAVAIATRKGIRSSARQEVFARIQHDRNPSALALYGELVSNAEQQGRADRDGSAEARAKLDSLRRREGEIERRLIAESAHYREWRKPADPDALASALAVGTVLIDVARFRTFDVMGIGKTEERYAAIVYKKGARPQLAFLGLAEVVDQAVVNLRSNFENMWTTTNGQRTLIRGEEFLNNLRHTQADCATLYQLTMAKLRAPLGTARRLLISPDGRLAEIPWEVLRDGAGKYLIEDNYRIVYLDSARALADTPPQARPRSNIAVIANVDYDGKSGKSAPMAANEGFALETEEIPGGGLGHSGVMKWRPLHGGDEILRTMRELESAGKLGPVEKLAKGSEEEMMALDRPAAVIVHTHGFFWTPGAGGDTQTTADGLNSGIVLYGANRADEKDHQGRDGWLTAKEVMLLNLEGTKLAAFFGCDTGRGAEAGEGVQGLRHALAVAGARSTLLTLWEVGDLSSARFLRELLMRLGGAKALDQTLLETRLAFLRGEVREDAVANRWIHPYFWAAATLAGQGGVVDLGPK